VRRSSAPCRLHTNDSSVARASAESHPGDLAEQAAEDYRRWVRALLTGLAAQAGVREPEILARQLHLLYDGSGQSARMDHDPAPRRLPAPLRPSCSTRPWPEGRRPRPADDLPGDHTGRAVPATTFRSRSAAGSTASTKLPVRANATG